MKDSNLNKLNDYTKDELLDVLKEVVYNYEIIFHYLHMRGHEYLPSEEEYEDSVHEEVLNLFLKGPKFYAICEQLMSNPKKCVCSSWKYLERSAHMSNLLGEKIEKSGVKFKRERPM